MRFARAFGRPFVAPASRASTPTSALHVVSEDYIDARSRHADVHHRVLSCVTEGAVGKAAQDVPRFRFRPVANRGLYSIDCGQNCPKSTTPLGTANAFQYVFVMPTAGSSMVNPDSLLLRRNSVAGLARSEILA
jgi:hypothetical protein